MKQHLLKTALLSLSVFLCATMPTTARNDISLNVKNTETPEVSQTAQSSTGLVVTGTVYDENGNRLQGTTVVVKEKISNGTVTGVDGSFRLTEVEPNSTLIISSVGFVTQQYVVKENPTGIRIIMKTEVQKLDDVIITGYQTISKERATGSFAVVTAEKLETKLQPSIKSVLEGQAAGMVLSKEGNIEIRGVSTFTGSKEPLIVVDGYPLIGREMNIDFVNPENIATITILKDAVAASIYGSQSSNGVIVITTKTGSASQRAGININYKGTYGVTLKPDMSKLNIAKVADYMDAEADLYNQNPNSYLSSYNSYSKLSDYTYLLLARDQGWISASEFTEREAILKNNDALKEIQDKLIRAKQSHQHNISISNGSEFNMFNVSMRYMEEFGNVIEDKNSRVTIDINDRWNPTKWLRVNLFSNFNFVRANTPTETYQTLTSFASNSKIMPYSRLANDDGSLNYWTPVGQRKLSKYESYEGMKPVYYNPVDDIPLSYMKTERLQLRFGGDVSINFCDFLTGSFGGTWTRGSGTNRTINEVSSFNMRTAYNDGTSATNSSKHYIPDGGKIDENRSTLDTWVLRSQLNYNQSFNNFKHRLSALFGNEILRDTYEISYLPTRLGYDAISASYNSGFNPYEYNNNTGNIRGDFLFGINPTYLGTIGYGNNYSVRDKRTVAWYGNASYEYDSKIILSGSIRWELSNFYGTDPKFRYKPTWSVGGTYKMAEENYFSGLKDVFDIFNLRATYGVLGSNSLDYTPYLILSVGTHNTTTGGVSYGISSFPNNQLRYEKKRTLDLGIDMSMLDRKINLTLDYYRNNSYDLIASEAVDETKGTSSLAQNVGEITNQGLEATANVALVNHKNFDWNTAFIFSYNKTHVDHYNVTRMYFSSYASANGIRVQGYPEDGLWGGRFAGLDDTGTAMFYNKAGEKVEGGSLKAEDAVYLGTLRPTTNLSWTNSFRYKNVELSFMFIAKLGAKYRKDNFSGSNYTNRHVAERWREAGDENKTIYPKLTSWNMDMFYFPYSDVLIGNANYLKLRDLTLSYNLPKNFVRKIRLNGVKAYFQTRNLFYITAKGVDIDPEVAEVNTTGGTGAMTNQGFTSLQLRPEFYFGIMINL